MQHGSGPLLDAAKHMKTRQQWLILLAGFSCFGSEFSPLDFDEIFLGAQTHDGKRLLRAQKQDEEKRDPRRVSSFGAVAISLLTLPRRSTRNALA